MRCLLATVFREIASAYCDCVTSMIGCSVYDYNKKKKKMGLISQKSFLFLVSSCFYIQTDSCVVISETASDFITVCF